MVRAGRGGVFASEWLEKGYIAIYWSLGGIEIDGKTREEIKSIYSREYPGSSVSEIASQAGQIFRFGSEMQQGDTAVMYDPSSRTYHVGAIAGPCIFEKGTFPDNEDRYGRRVVWNSVVLRDALPAAAKNALGAISTIFSISDETMASLERASEISIVGADQDLETCAEGETPTEIRQITADEGIERIKDKVSSLAWDDMELLTAGLLRAMGYKTSMTGKGSDGGRDVVASPDGLGLELPRIIVEVKHRKGAIGAPLIRSFIGGLRPSDSGLYVSTGGFTKEARYEADRSSIPLRLLDLDEFVRLLVDNYDQADAETRAILPLVRIYWPA